MAEERSVSPVAAIEWEGLQQPYAIQTLQTPPAIAATGLSMRLWRNESYQLRAALDGPLTPDRVELQDAPAGSFADVMTITGANTVPGVIMNDRGKQQQIAQPFQAFEVSGCVPNETGFLATDQAPAQAAVSLSVWSVRRTHLPARNTARVVTWYLNGPKSIAWMAGMLQRQTHYTRRTFDPDRIAFPPLVLNSHEQPCAIIKSDGLQFLMYAAPRECGPAWSRNFAIEYRHEWGDIPDEDTREAIGEVVSFIIGRRLLSVGYSTFDDRAFPVDEVSWSPQGENSTALCSRPDRSPVLRDSFSGMRKLDGILQQIVPAYLELRDAFNLKDALWYYWLCLEHVIGPGLPMLSSALEVLTNGWFMAHPADTPWVHVPQDQFKDVTKQPFLDIENALKRLRAEGLQQAATEDERKKVITEEAIRKVMGRMGNAYQMFGPFKRDMFLAGLPLAVGKTEIDAFENRHGLAHGASITDPRNFRSLSRTTAAYLTTFERVLLKLLGYAGDYVDRSAPEYPLTPIDTPLHGWDLPDGPSART